MARRNSFQINGIKKYERNTTLLLLVARKMILWRDIILLGFIGVNSFYDVTLFYGQRTNTKNDMTKLAIFNGQNLGF